MTYHNGQKFSTIDEDNDKAQGQCASLGAWWYCISIKLNQFKRYSSGLL
jgi:hypothetical protein